MPETAVYALAYGLRWPTEREIDVRMQMELAHRYRNKLVEIERGRREAVRSTLSRNGLVDLELAAARAEAEESAAAAAVSAAKGAARAGKGPPELVAALRTARAATAEARSLLAAERRRLKADPRVQAEVALAAGVAGALVRGARANCGVYWGTYLLIEAEMQASAKMPYYDGTRPNDPRFQRWTGEGQIGVQCQGGVDVADLDRSPHLRITEREAVCRKTGAPLTGRRAAGRKFLWFRVGTEEGGRDPVWAVFPMVMHRPLPPGRVKRAVVNLERVARRDVWTVCITVETEAPAQRPAVPLPEAAAVALDLGWRVIGDRLRVAYWRDRAGRSGEFCLPPDLLAGLRKASELRSIRARNLTAILPVVAAALDAAPRELLREWWLPLLPVVRRLESPDRLAAVVTRWKRSRWEGDEAAYAAAEAWRYNDDHLRAWEAEQRRGALARRLDLYRCFAKDLAARYDVVVLEKFDLRDVARRPRPDESAGNETARSNRQLAAVGELRRTVVQASAMAGGAVRWAPAPGTTVDCHVCKATADFDAAADLTHTCAACATFWDQDDNACWNLLAWLGEQSGDGDAAEVAPAETADGEAVAPANRWAKARAIVAERKGKAAGIARGGAAESQESSGDE